MELDWLWFTLDLAGNVRAGVEKGKRHLEAL
jgi:hypothetical protein